MKTNSIYYWILFSTFLLIACNKRDLVKKEDYKQFKDWLSVNGQAYKGGALNKIGADGKIQQLNLDWSNTSSYKIDGIDYTEVRFVNSNSGNDDLKSATNIFNNSESGDVFFSLVFRNRFGKIEGAVKWTDENSTFKQEGKDEQGSVEFYHDLNNNLINAWLFEKKTKKLMVLNKVVTDINSPQSLSKTKVQGGGCITVQVKSYVSFSEITPPGDGHTLEGVAVGWHVFYQSFQLCGGGGSPGGGGGSPAPGPGGGPGIGILPGSSADTTWPSKKQEPPEPKKNPCPINLDQLKKAIPGNVTQQETLKKLIGLLDKWGPQFGFDNEYKVRHFMAQMAHETGGLNTLAKLESLDYRESRLLRIWPNMFSTIPSQWNGAGCYNPKEFAHNDEKLANLLWAFSNGNHQPGDGWKFRGRGVLQLNGRGNYTEFRDFYNKLFPANKLDFVESPDLLNSTDEIALLSGMWWCKRYLWKKFKWNENTSVDQVSGMVNKFKKNAKAVGQDERRKYFQDINKFVDCD